jgi:hypothetical protein
VSDDQTPRKPGPTRKQNGQPRKPNGQWKHKLTEEILELIRLAITSGTAPDFAGPYAGVDRSTFYRWMSNGRNGGTRLERELVAVVARSESTFVVNENAAITRDADARTRLDRLARRFPEHYGRRDHLVTEGTVAHTFTLDTAKLTESELAALEALHLKAISDGDDGEPGQLLQLPPGENRA